MSLTSNQKKTIIAISAITLTGAIATFIYFRIKNKTKKPNKLTEQLKTEPTTQKGLFNPNPEDVSSNPLVVKLKDKIFKLNYLIDPFGVSNGKVVYVEAKDFKPEKPNQPVPKDMQIGMWTQIQKRIDDVSAGFNQDIQTDAARIFGNEELKKLQDRLDSIFNPIEFNKNSDWYKKYLETINKKNVNTNFWS